MTKKLVSRVGLASAGRPINPSFVSRSGAAASKKEVC